MNKYPMTDVVASREYQVTNGDTSVMIEAAIGRPARDEGLPHGWYCTWSITRGGSTRVWHTVGDDALQALLLALSGMRADLQRIASVGKLVCMDGIEGPYVDLVG